MVSKKIIHECVAAGQWDMLSIYISVILGDQDADVGATGDNSEQ